MKKSFNIRELLHCKSNRCGTKAHAPHSPHWELSKDTQEQDLKHPSSVDLITTKQKQNKLPFLLDRNPGQIPAKPQGSQIVLGGQIPTNK